MAAPDAAGYVLMNIMRDIDFLEANGEIDRSQANAMRYPLKQHMHLAEPFLGESAAASALTLALPSSASPPPAAALSAQISAMSLASSPPAQERAKVVWDHVPKAQDIDELLLRKNDVVVITERSSDEWWKGYVQGRDPPTEGKLFPANYVEIIKAATLPPRPAGAVGQRAVPVAPHSAHTTAPAGTGTRARFSSSRVGTAPTAAPTASPAGLETETEEMRKERQAKMTRVANSNAGRHAIGGFAAGTGASIARSIF